MSQKVYSAKYRYLKRCATDNNYPVNCILKKTALQNVDISNNEYIDEYESYQPEYYEDDFDLMSDSDTRGDTYETEEYNIVGDTTNKNHADLSLNILSPSNSFSNSNVQLITFLTEWSKKFSVTHIQITTLLKGLNQHLT